MERKKQKNEKRWLRNNDMQTQTYLQEGDLLIKKANWSERGGQVMKTGENKSLFSSNKLE